MSEKIASASSLRRMWIFLRSCSDSTSGSSKPLAMMRNPEEGCQLHGYCRPWGGGRTKKTRISIDMYAMARFSSPTPLLSRDDLLKFKSAFGNEFAERGISQKKSQPQNFVCSKVTVREHFLRVRLGFEIEIILPKIKTGPDLFLLLRTSHQQRGPPLMRQSWSIH